MATVSTKHPAPRGGRQAPVGAWWPLIAIVLAVFMLMLDATVVTVALPKMQHDLHSSLTGVQWVMDAYMLAMAAFQLTAGWLADRLGRRRTLLVAVVIFAAASLVCGLAATAGVLIAARVVQGLAGAVMFAATLALIAQCYEGQARAMAFGIRGMVAGVAVVAGPVLGGLIVSALSWRWVFWINLPVCAATVAIGWRVLPRHEPVHRGRRLDLSGPVLLAAALVLLILGLLRSDTHSWSSTVTVAMLAGAVVALLAFVAVERRHADPILDLRVFSDPSFTGTQVGSFVVQASIFAVLIYLSLYFQNILDYSPLRTGLCFLLLVGPILLAGPIAGAVMDRLPKRYLVASALAALAVGLLLMHGITTGSTWTHVAAGLVICGFACGLALPVLGNLAVDIPDPRRLGMAAGVNNTMLQIGAATGIAVYGSIINNSHDLIDGLNHSFIIAGLVAACGAVLTATMIRNHRQELP